MSCDKRKNIMDAAIELFSQKGFEGTSMRDLANKANVNLAMINYYFGSKEKLLQRIFEDNASYLSEVLHDIVEDKNLTQIEKFSHFVDFAVAKMRVSRNFHKLWHLEVMLNQRGLANDKIKKIIGTNNWLIHKIIADGIDSGEFRENIDIPLVTCTIFGTVNHIFLSRTIGEIVFSADWDKDNPYNEELISRLNNYLKSIMRLILLR